MSRNPKSGVHLSHIYPYVCIHIYYTGTCTETLIMLCTQWQSHGPATVQPKTSCKVSAVAHNDCLFLRPELLVPVNLQRKLSENPKYSLGHRFSPGNPKSRKPSYSKNESSVYSLYTCNTYVTVWMYFFIFLNDDKGRMSHKVSKSA